MQIRRYCLGLLALCLVAFGIVGHGNGVASAQGGTGSIEGHVTLSGRPPGNRVIRMGADPKCTQVDMGELVIQEAVMATRNGSLGNVFVNLEGDFPATPVTEETGMFEMSDVPEGTYTIYAWHEVYGENSVGPSR